MTNPFLNNKNTIFRGSRVLIPFFSDLNTWYKKIVGTIFNESINNLDARFLPRVASFNETDDLINLSSDINIGKKHTIIVDLKANNTATHVLLGHQSSTTRWLLITPFLVGYRINAVNNTISYNVLSTDKELKIVRDGVNLELFIDGVSKGTQTIAGINNLDFVFSQIGARVNDFYYDGLISKIDIVSTDQTSFLMYPTGQGGFDYDLVSGTIYGTWSGTGTHYDFDLNGSTRPNDVGYSIWRKAANPDIQVPFDVNGAALSLTAGVNIPAGYSHERDVPAGGDNHNIYESLVDMEYGSLLQCDTDGIAYATQTEAYGLVFDGIFKKTSSSDILDIIFISDAISQTFSDNYWFRITNDEELVLLRSSSDLLITAASYISLNTNYRLLTWRNETTNQFVTGAAGTFVVYIQGKTKAITTKKYDIPNTNEMELITVDAGSNPTAADNTYTTSKYIVNDLDAGNQVSKIEVNGKYISPYDFTVSTGAYSIINNPKNAIYRRSNVTKQTATSRASLFYDADYPFIYHIDEISDPRVYNLFFKPDYASRIFGKVRLLGTEIIRLDELPNYANKKENEDLVKVQRYCGITDIYHVYGAEILINGNFEAGISTPPADWNDAGNHVLSSVADGTAPVGSNVAEIVSSGAFSSGGNYISAEVDGVIVLENGKIYVLSFWAKSISGNTTLRNNQDNLNDQTITTDWVYYTYIFEAVSVGFRIGLANTGVARIDSVSIREQLL